VAKKKDWTVALRSEVMMISSGGVRVQSFEVVKFAVRSERAWVSRRGEDCWVEAEEKILILKKVPSARTEMRVKRGILRCLHQVIGRIQLVKVKGIV
jgi:hypothetical protein